jgi:hypothetical protein
MVKKNFLQTSQNLSSFEENYSHSFWRILLIMASILSFIILIIYNRTNDIDLNNILDFENENSELFHFIWYIIYAWQGLWLIYGLTTILRKSSDDYLYKYPPVMHWLIYTNFLITNILNLCSSTLTNNRLYILSTFYYFLILIAILISLVQSILQLHDYQREMYYTEKHADIWILRLLVQNGLLIYASWSFIFFLINLKITLVYEFSMSSQASALIILAALNFKIVINFILENFLFYKYLKFLFSSWLIFILFLIIFLINFKHTSSNYLTFACSIITFANLLILFTIKVIIFLRIEVFYKNRLNN